MDDEQPLPADDCLNIPQPSMHFPHDVQLEVRASPAPEGRKMRGMETM